MISKEEKTLLQKNRHTMNKVRNDILTILMKYLQLPGAMSFSLGRRRLSSANIYSHNSLTFLAWLSLIKL